MTSKVDIRQTINLLRFLAGCGKSGAAIMPVDNEGSGEMKLRLMREDGAEFRADEVLLNRLARGGAIRMTRQRATITEAGKKALKRMLCAGPDSFAAQHGMRQAMGSPGERMPDVNLDESPLSALSRLRRKDGSQWFPDELIRAGDRLRVDFTRGQLMPGLGVRFEAPSSRGTGARGDGIAELTDAAIAARGRVRAASEAIGPELSGLVLDVCCYLKGLETVERERQWPPRSAKLVLRTALEMLARHYAPSHPRKPSDIRSWGGVGYRPDMAADIEV